MFLGIRRGNSNVELGNIGFKEEWGGEKMEGGLNYEIDSGVTVGGGNLQRRLNI